MVEIAFKSLRVNLRKASKRIIDHVVTNHIHQNSNKKLPLINPICIFCGSPTELTKEHVLPIWTFEGAPEQFFVTDVNGQNQTYNKTTVPACSLCNNNWLSSIERYIVNALTTADLSKRLFSIDEIENIIRWLEIIEYKFQVLEGRRKFIVSKGSRYIPYLSGLPISVMRKEIDYSPSKAVTQIRVSQKRVTIKSKINKRTSLVVFKTTNKSFHFFHQLDQFFFIELAKFNVAFFYFYNKEFKTERAAYKEAMKIIKGVYET